MIVARALVGVIVGVAYGLLIGILTFVQWRLTHDPAYPGPMIPDNNAWGRLVIEVTTSVVSFCGALTGAVVGATEVNKTKGALLGGLIGLVVFLLLALGSLLLEGNGILTHPLKLLLDQLIVFVIFPVGLAIVGLVAAFTVGMLTSIRSKTT
jgi:hypothetical protein